MSYRKVILGILFILTFGILPMLFIRFNHPEKAILGTWKETAWTYELVDKKKGADKNISSDTSLEHAIFKGLSIHKSETWRFTENSALILNKENQKPVQLKWKLKGRGHILKLDYQGNATEYYQIKELSDKKMVLHFENDVHARGIVKIVFTKQQK